MSQSTEPITVLPEGDYEITSILATSNEPTGVDSNKPPFQPVRSAGASVWVWHIKPEPDFIGGYRLSLVNAFPFTGIVGAKFEVVATDNKSEDRLWFIQKWQDDYVIASALTTSTPAWTVPYDDPKAKVVITSFGAHPEKNQLFKIVPTSG